MVKLAEFAEVVAPEPDNVHDPGFITIGGEEFPWHVQRDDIEVELLGDGDPQWHVLRVGIIVKGPVNVNGEDVTEWWPGIEGVGEVEA